MHYYTLYVKLMLRLEEYYIFRTNNALEYPDISTQHLSKILALFNLVPEPLAKYRLEPYNDTRYSFLDTN